MRYRAKMKVNHDSRHNANNMEPISPGQTVYLTNEKCMGKVEGKSETPRSYLVAGPNGTVIRNRSHLKLIPNKDEAMESQGGNQTTKITGSQSSESDSSVTITRSGRVSKPPDRLGY